MPGFFVFILFFSILHLIQTGYPPIGDEVQAGSVLLPATRRGRYLANIVRRQAVDGTGIKFNKDADRMNAEAKKKVDVLSEELLPYIIAEQERRITLHKRVMVAIQNGERGVTIAEIRNRPPIFIKRGVYYRCPGNRAPLEPDGSGNIMCTRNIVPSQVIYDSCLHSEDATLYLNQHKEYFYCNRHKEIIADLPINDKGQPTACPHMERTLYNHTLTSCTLEETDDIVVHYRYYPDRTYKYVSEIDPDREVCEHWNPCQIGYIFSIASLEQAVLADDIFTINQTNDSPEEFMNPSLKGPYKTSPRRLNIPKDHMFTGVKVTGPDGKTRDLDPKYYQMITVPDNTRRGLGCFAMIIQFIFSSIMSWMFGSFYCVFQHDITHKEIQEKVVQIERAKIHIKPFALNMMIGQVVQDVPVIEFYCGKCQIRHITQRHCDTELSASVDMTKCRQKVSNLKEGQFVVEHVPGKKSHRSVRLIIEKADKEWFGDFFLVVKDADGEDEKIKMATIEAIQLTTEFISGNESGGVSRYIPYHCSDCKLTDIMCNGVSVYKEQGVKVLHAEKQVGFSFPFDDSHACAYVAYFEQNWKTYYKTLVVIDNAYVTLPPHEQITVKEGEQIEKEVQFTCRKSCFVQNITVNGCDTDKINEVPMESRLRLSIENLELSDVGVYQARFLIEDRPVTKTLFELTTEEVKATEVATEATTNTASDAAATASDAATTASDASETTTESSTPPPE